MAARALEAFASGDADGYLGEVRPDQRGFAIEWFLHAGLKHLNGCNVAQAKFLTEQGRKPGNATVIAVFDAPCGANLDGKFGSCKTYMVNLSGRWYIDEGTQCYQ